MIWKPISDPDHPLLAAREAPCGAVATTERGQARCWRCRSTEDDNAFGTDRPSNLEEIRRQHHIPAEAYATWIRVPGETFDEPQWHVDHVRIQMFTLPVEPGVSFIPLRFPWAFAPLPVINRPGIVARWRLRHVGKPGVLDMMWDYGRKDLDWRTRDLPPEARADQGRLIALLCPQPTVRHSGGPRAMSDEAAFEQAVRFGQEWLGDHQGRHPKDFGRAQFAAKRCTGIDATNQWMRGKHFGIRRVQQELAKRVRWPT